MKGETRVQTLLESPYIQGGGEGYKVRIASNMAPNLKEIVKKRKWLFMGVLQEYLRSMRIEKI